MKLSSHLLLALIGVAIFSSTGFAQGPSTNMELNRAPLRYFSGVELEELANQDEIKSTQIKYYFTQSFDVNRIDCRGCEVEIETFYNIDLFNIVEFESLRLSQSEVDFTFKGKYKITLKSLEDVLVELGGIEPADVLKIKLSKPFPEWVSTGDDDGDFKLYKSSVDKWARDFPELFRTMTSSPDLLKISFSDFIVLIDNRKEELFTRPGGYIIID